MTLSMYIIIEGCPRVRCLGKRMKNRAALERDLLERALTLLAILALTLLP